MHRRMQFRIGINLGDVIEEDGALYGDGVNVAARLEALAEAGGICIWGTAFDQVDGKLVLAFKSIGEQQVKNIPKPVRAYRVLMDTPTLEVPTPVDSQEPQSRTRGSCGHCGDAGGRYRLEDAEARWRPSRAIQRPRACDAYGTGNRSSALQQHERRP